MIQHDPSLRNAPFFNSAFNFLKLPALMSKLGFAKRSGVSAFDIFLMTFTSIMFGYKNIYQYFTSASHREDKISLDAAYRFLKNPHYNWSGLLKAITVRCISFLSNEVNPHKLPCCLVVDDTCIERTKSIKSELLAKIWNHVDQKFIRGYQCLTLGWTDGISFLPLIARMISSGSKKNRYFEAMAKVDGRTRSGRLRKMAIMPKPQQVISMCREALACGVKAEYVLFDSWFFSEHMLASLHELGLSVISLVKSNLKFALTEDGIALTQRQLQQIIGQRQPKRRKDILGESLAFFHGMAVKLVFVRNRTNPSTIITIVSTDLQLCAEDVVRL